MKKKSAATLAVLGGTLMGAFIGAGTNDDLHSSSAEPSSLDRRVKSSHPIAEIFSFSGQLSPFLSCQKLWPGACSTEETRDDSPDGAPSQTSTPDRMDADVQQATNPELPFVLRQRHLDDALTRFRIMRYGNGVEGLPPPFNDESKGAQSLRQIANQVFEASDKKANDLAGDETRAAQEYMRLRAVRNLITDLDRDQIQGQGESFNRIQSSPDQLAKDLSGAAAAYEQALNHGMTSSWNDYLAMGGSEQKSYAPGIVKQLDEFADFSREMDRASAVKDGGYAARFCHQTLHIRQSVRYPNSFCSP